MIDECNNRGNMKSEIVFEIHFDTRPGEEIFITGSIPELGSLRVEEAVKMEYSNGKWRYALKLKSNVDISYSYFLKDEQGKTMPEAGPTRFLKFGQFNKCIVYDQWQQYNEETPFRSNAFRNVFYKSENISSVDFSDILITCSANNIKDNQFICISGSTDALGKWNENDAVKMHRSFSGIWHVSFKKAEVPPLTEYKFILKSGDSTMKWEEGINRFIPEYENKSDLIIVNNHTLNLPAERGRFAGTAIPVFSLRSENSCGIGEFLDIIPFADFLHKTGQRVLQILPVNDTTMNNTWEDSYPYGAISIFALHPLYINLLDAGRIKDEEFFIKHTKEAARLNSLEEIDYDGVAALKWSYLRKLYQQEGEKTLKSKSFKEFFKQNEDWLVPYALFSFFRDKFSTPDFSNWEEWSTYRKEDALIFTKPESKQYSEIAFYYFIQFHLDRQLKYAHEYVNSKGIILKGDIPIGINKNSVEAWFEPHYFNFNGQAGAPPDDFSIKGQNWGFPTYNWDVMERDGYEWWKKRFRKMSEYFDSYRIDHILGFFRIWEIPVNAVDGLLGYFNPSLPFTADEIRNLGYEFDYERDCIPYIRESSLKNIFKDDYLIVTEIFFDNIGWDLLKLKKEFSTQRDIGIFIDNNPELDKFRESLFSIVSEVLFIPDPYDLKRYHPRISSQFTESYSSLPEHKKEAYNKIYNQFFYHRNDGFWFYNAMKKLPSLISSTNMLVCGEDLGMIPSCVPSAMNSLRILSLEIERMPKDPNSKFGNTNNYPYLSVCTTGTHDTSTIRGWWEENRTLTNDYYRLILGESGNPPQFCEPWICKKIIKNHLSSGSMLTILPLQDWLSISSGLRRENPHSERINIPANPKHYWKYRMHLTISELTNEDEFIAELLSMIKDSGR